VDNNLTNSEINELVLLFPTWEEGRELLAECGLPARTVSQLPVDDIRRFWSEAARHLAAGVLHSGRARLLDAARGHFPANQVFAPATGGLPASAGNFFQHTGSGAMNVYQAPVTVAGPDTASTRPATRETKVFFAGASPYDIDLDRLRADREFRAIQDVARPGRLRVVNRTAATLDDLADLLDERPNILHLSCHTKGDTLLFEDPTGEPHPVGVASLVRRMRAYQDHAEFRLSGLVLSACGSADFAAAFTSVADDVVAWDGDIDDDCAILFARALYRALARESSPALRDAARLAAIEVGDSDSHCQDLASRLTVLPP
jgi:hypothetical protein